MSTMSHTTEPTAAIDAARAVLSAHPSVELAVLFGSAARGEARVDSDLDIGFLASDALRSDIDRQDALSMSLLVVIQEAIDIAFHVVSDEGWGVPGSYREGFELLTRAGVLDEDTAMTLAGMAALRNRLARGYASVDIDRIWHELPAGFAAVDAFVGAIAHLLEQEAE